MPPATAVTGLPLLGAGLPAPALGAFTTRRGGVSVPPYDELDLGTRSGDAPAAVRDNRALLAARLGLAPGALAFAEQVHGAGVVVVEGPGPEGGAPGVDALVTRTRGLGLVVLAADCLPVVLADPVARLVAVAHAGRQGLVAGVLQQVLAVLAAEGGLASRTTAVVGPAAGACCYELPAAMVGQVAGAVPSTASRTRAGTPSVDLRAGAEAVLRAAGVGVVRHVTACTVEDPRFYSYRRDRVTGRHAGVALLR